MPRTEIRRGYPSARMISVNSAHGKKRHRGGGGHETRPAWKVSECSECAREEVKRATQAVQPAASGCHTTWHAAAPIQCRVPRSAARPGTRAAHTAASAVGSAVTALAPRPPPHTQARYAHPAAPATTVPTHALVSTAARPVAPRHGRHNAPRSSRNDMLTACTPVHLATDAAQCPHRRDLSGCLAPHTGCAHTYACRPRTGAESITQATAAHAKQASIQVAGGRGQEAGFEQSGEIYSN